MAIKLHIDDPGLTKALRRNEKQSQDFMDAFALSLTAEWREMMGSTPRQGDLSGPSQPGHPPAIQTGNLINSLGQFRKNGLDRDFYAPDYALFLNDSAQLNRPFIEPGIEEVKQRDLVNLAKEHLGG